MDPRKERIIVLVDMDCFYVQVEQKLCPEYLDKPCAVVQYNTWKGGGIIAVNYEARARGVKRFGRGEDAQRACPDIHLFSVPEVRGKADLTRYREAGASVMEVLCKFCDCVERASIDEAYLDLTELINVRMQEDNRVSADQIPNTFVIGWEDKENNKAAVESWLQAIYDEDQLYHDRMLATAAVIVEEMRAAVFKETGFKCSAGVAHNKMLSKLSCGLHKPNKQTVLPLSSIPILYKTIPIKKVRNLGGKLGEQVMLKLNAKTMEDLLNLPKAQFVNNFGDKTGTWLYNVSRGIENETVTPRQLPKSIGCGKNFPGKSSLNTKEKVKHWLKQLASELEERLLKDLENNHRIARLLTVSIRNTSTPGYSTVSKSCPIHVYNAEKIAHDAFMALQKFNSSSNSSWTPGILTLAMAAGKFEDRLNVSTNDIQSYFNTAMSPTKKIRDNCDPSSSNIDTVLDLIENESTSITPQVNNIVLKRDNSDLKISNYGHKARGISSFFSTEAPSTSKLNILTEEGATKAPLSYNDDFESNQMLERNLKDINTTLNGNVSSKIVGHMESSFVSTKMEISNNGMKQKPKGFFAKKLEEKLNHNATSEDNVLNKTDDHLDSSASTKMEISKNDTEQKPKGFFARKLEEKLKALNPDTLTLAHSSTFESPIDKSSKDNCDQTMSSITSNSGIIEQSIFSESSVEQYPLLEELDPELTIQCLKCNRRIPVWEEEEHADYHVAFDLSRELRKDSVVKKSLPVQNSVKGIPTKSRTNRKRGSTTKSVSNSKKPVQQNTLDSFFKCS
ncbi:DNA polymerase eta [Nephila pilipes]|uniref:DNA polymerase eta n=1 Tax=Nephila pilipes TaxID=299642 RepID=A0A8X6P3H2_NEPPI|nr:DNA polymerase eta [Nephila pilipes]